MNERDYLNFNMLGIYDKRMKKAIKKAKKRGTISSAEAKELSQMNFADIASMVALMVGETDIAQDFQKFGTVKVPEEQLNEIKRKQEEQKNSRQPAK